MNRNKSRSGWAALFVFIVLFFAGSAFSQDLNSDRVPTLSADTSINPHDFTDEYYAMNGVFAPAIFGRRNGTDALSVFGISSNPFHTNVRVVATIPAYDQNGNILYWYPLGELQATGFIDDKVGARARELASRFPIYVFPTTSVVEFRTFANTRQAALLDNTWAQNDVRNVNPLGLREIFVVNYTEKAFGKEGVEMMLYFAKKNGSSVDNTPIIRTLEDLSFLLKNEMVEASSLRYIGGRYAINPEINDPTNGVIAPDAYLWMATMDGKALPREDMFVWQFYCLQKTGSWCN